jgi:hypothetical protein
MTSPTLADRHRERAGSMLTPRNNWMLERPVMRGRGDGAATLGRELEAGERVLVIEFNVVALALSAVERETIERAAKVAHNKMRELVAYMDMGGEFSGEWITGVAAAIRALAGRKEG